MKFLFAICVSLIYQTLCCQPYTENKKDSLENIHLQEVIVIGSQNLPTGSSSKISKNIDEYLLHSSKVNLIRRGNYAWEPIINSMLSEKSTITIDGMHIFGACTDKMDPITSYIEPDNLSEIQFFSGQKGNYSGTTTSGGINFIRKSAYFLPKNKWLLNLKTGYESNGHLRSFSGKNTFSSKNTFAQVSALFRKSQSYKSGNHKIVNHSQFQKFNLSSVIGKKISENQTIQADIIYDKANDVGYPALTMDVSVAEAIIGSLTYSLSKHNSWFSQWKSKIYYNTIFHLMDDSSRSETYVHMDMPGKNQTIGGLSSVVGGKNNHKWKFQISSYMNWAEASMTMYPIEPTEKKMFMYTWPIVQTLYSNISLSHRFAFANHHFFTIKTLFGVSRQSVLSKQGYNSLKIFFPTSPQHNIRWLPSIHFHWEKHTFPFSHSLELGYGQRAPSVSEAYGFYLYNNFDQYDYIGNPHLHNEKSLQTQYSISYRKDFFKLQSNINYFFISDYILGENSPNISPMSYQAQGVRMYKALKYVHILNADIDFQYNLSSNISYKANIKYSFAQDYSKKTLPLIPPIQYQSGIYFNHNLWQIDFTTKGAFNKTNFREDYGESYIGSYIIFNTSFLYRYNHFLTLQIGTENLLNKHYYTYSDWKGAPQKGRSVYVYLMYNF